MQFEKITFPAEVEVHRHGKYEWEVLEDFVVVIRTVGADQDVTLTVPKGFITDFASVPRVFWNIFPPFGEYTEAAVAHDYLYRHGGVIPGWVKLTKDECDEVFLKGMESLGVGTVTRHIMWTAVAAFGKGSFKDDGK